MIFSSVEEDCFLFWLCFVFKLNFINQYNIRARCGRNTKCWGGCFFCFLNKLFKITFIWSHCFPSRKFPTFSTFSVWVRWNVGLQITMETIKCRSEFLFFAICNILHTSLWIQLNNLSRSSEREIRDKQQSHHNYSRNCLVEYISNVLYNFKWYLGPFIPYDIHSSYWWLQDTVGISVSLMLIIFWQPIR